MDVICNGFPSKDKKKFNYNSLDENCRHVPHYVSHYSEVGKIEFGTQGGTVLIGDSRH